MRLFWPGGRKDFSDRANGKIGDVRELRPCPKAIARIPRKSAGG